ncbi:MAG: ribose-5-phosphate isomerase RpiA [Oscillochloridaceae bacterium umkhey_bin13]
MNDPQRETLKQQAAEAAVTLVQAGMVVGLGFGSTAIYAVRRIAVLLAEGQLPDLVGVPCTEWTANEARRLGIPLTTLDACPTLDLTIDGADEVDPQLDLIKGGGAALLREKMVAQASRRVAIVVDAAKCSPTLGTRFALPVEVVPFGWGASARFIGDLGARVTRRMGQDGTPVVTDQGNFVLDCAFGPIPDLAALARQLEQRAGIVEHGLFLGLATDLFVADAAGVSHTSRPNRP